MGATILQQSPSSAKVEYLTFTHFYWILDDDNVLFSLTVANFEVLLLQADGPACQAVNCIFQILQTDRVVVGDYGEGNSQDVRAKLLNCIEDGQALPSGGRKSPFSLR